MSDASYRFANVGSMALCAWREARGEGGDGMLAVLNVIHNRSKTQNMPDAAIVYQPMQFTSMTYHIDPEFRLFPDDGDAQWLEAQDIASKVLANAVSDNTGGATHYFNPSVVLPKWAAALTKTCVIGHHVFYR